MLPAAIWPALPYPRGQWDFSRMREIGCPYPTKVGALVIARNPHPGIKGRPHLGEAHSTAGGLAFMPIRCFYKVDLGPSESHDLLGGGADSPVYTRLLLCTCDPSTVVLWEQR